MGYADNAQVYHAELTGVSNALHILREGQQVLVLSDSQAALKSIARASPSTAQTLLKDIYDTLDTLGSQNTRFQWVPGHKGVEGNEKADIAAKRAANAIGPHNRPPIRFLSAIYPSFKKRVKTEWEDRWTRSNKGRNLHRLSPAPSPATRMLFTRLPKAESTLAVQLRTGKIGFNAFLYERQVPSVPSPRCHCGLGSMTVLHILTVCPSWNHLRRRFLHSLRTTDIRKILGTPKGIKAAVRFTLAINLLAQFSRITCEEQEERRLNAGSQPSQLSSA